MKTYSFTFFYPAPDCVTCVIRKDGRASPVATASRDSRERALLAALNDASISWVPGTCNATRLVGSANKVENIRLEFRAGAPSPFDA